MPQAPIEQRQFKGLLLGLDRKRVEEPYCVDGANFFVDLDGPISGFGKQYVVHDDVAEPRAMQTLFTADETDVYYMLGNSISRYNATSRQMYPVYRHATRTLWWPWTRAYVGPVLYFCNKEIGIVTYHTVTGVWALLSGAYVPPDPIAVCSSGGRLVILSELYLTWSKIDDGSNTGLQPSTATGAGFQILAAFLGANCRPVMILPYQDGVISYASTGIMRSELRESVNPFRHTSISAQHRILNPWCVVRVTELGGGGQSLIASIDETHVFLTARGLYQTDGRSLPALIDPIISEALHRDILPAIDTSTRSMMTTRLSYSFQTGWIMLSLSEDSTQAVYTRALCYYIPTKELGWFSQVHSGFGEIIVDNVIKPGLFDNAGDIWYFAFSDADGAFPVVNDFQINFKLPQDIPAEWHGLSVLSYFPDQISMPAVVRPEFNTADVYDTLYVIETADEPPTMPVMIGDETALDLGGSVTAVHDGFSFEGRFVRIGIQHMDPLAASLNAYVTIGPIRYPQQNKIDFLTQMQELIIGMLDAGAADQIDDWLANYSSDIVEDWLALSGTDDWGTSSGSQTTYQVAVSGTIDGYKVWESNGFAQYEVPTEILHEGRVKHFGCSVTGQYLYITITADDVGEMFHVRHMKQNVLNAGQVF